MGFMNEILFTVIEGIVVIMLILLMRYAVPYLKYKVLALTDQTIWEAIIREVKSVEQTMTGSGQGPAKKEEVMARIYLWAEKHGIQITCDQISQLIETAVFVLKNEVK